MKCLLTSNPNYETSYRNVVTWGPASLPRALQEEETGGGGGCGGGRGHGAGSRRGGDESPLPGGGGGCPAAVRPAAPA